MTDPSTIDAAIVVALDAYDALSGLGETVEDEWTYVTELTAAWQARLEEVAASRGTEAIDDRTAAAIDRAIDEIDRIEDPHRAIDWLSTFPQVILVALGEPT
jgi:hypothetical protein